MAGGQSAIARRRFGGAWAVEPVAQLSDKLLLGPAETLVIDRERVGIAPSYMTRVMRLTLRAPEIVEAVLQGRQGPQVTLARVLAPLSVEWEAQRRSFRQST